MTDFQKGQTVTFNRDVTAEHAQGMGYTHTFRAGDTAEVSVVRKHTISVRMAHTHLSWMPGWPARKEEVTELVSFNVPRSSLETPNGEVYTVPKAKPKPREIGVKPEGDHIAADDPRIQWLFEDAARVAKNAGHCLDYDRMCDRLGIPGRERSINVTLTINGIEVSSTVKARSTKEAEAMVREKLKDAK